MDQIILSVAIATRNRCEYCIEAVKIILELLPEKCELIIQDNSDDPSCLGEFIASIADEKIVYHYHAAPLSAIDNFNMAIANSSGEYICVLGDDDCITEDVIEVVHWMKKNNIESVCPQKNVDYIWPNNKIPAFNTGELRIPQFSGSKLKIDVQSQLIKLLQAGIIDYQKYGLPRVYHGIIKRSCLLKVKQQTGHFLGGLSPDIYATISLACIVESHYVIDYPFSIAGACPASTSVASKQGKHAGKLESAPHFINRGIYEWEKCIPQYYSVETIWAETALKALKEIQHENIYSMFNSNKFILSSILINRNQILKLAILKSLELYKHTGDNKYYYWVKLFGYTIWFVFRKSLVYFLRKVKKIHREKEKVGMNNVHSLKEALHRTSTALYNQRIYFK